MIKLLVAVATGAIAQEFIHWYGLRMNIAAQKYIKILRSPVYWMLVVGMIALAVGVGFIFLETTTDPKAAFIFGLSLPAFLKQLAAMKQARTHLGAGDNDAVIQSYFTLR